MRSHRFRPHGRLAKIFQHLNPKNSGQNTLFWALTRSRACAVVSRNFPDRFNVQKPSHQKDQTQAITKLPQLHFHDSHNSRGVISNIRLICTLQTINSQFTPALKIDFPCLQTPSGHEAGVKTNVWTRAWIFLHIFPIIRQLCTHLSSKTEWQHTYTVF